jgi:hypothetical protein
MTTGGDYYTKKRAANAELEAAARAYMKANPVIFKAKDASTSSKKTHGPKTLAKIEEIMRMFPGLSLRVIANLFSVSLGSVHEVKQDILAASGAMLFDKADSEDDEDICSHENNMRSSAAELRALRAAYPGRVYEVDSRSHAERNSAVVLFQVNTDRARYKVDQSHTTARPITLPTTPFKLAS